MTKTQPTPIQARVDTYPGPRMVFLGPPLVMLEGQPLRFRTRKTLALLIYLALEPGLHPRDKLSALFWSQADETQGRNSLRSTITRLNHALGGQWLINRRDTLGLDTSRPFELDVRELESAFKHAGNQGHDINLEATLQATANLYRGEFLEGFNLEGAPEFDDWVLARRELARQWLDTVLERLAELQAKSGRLPLALETAQRRLRLEILNEAAHRQVIGLHLQMGNRGAVQEAYLVCKRVLENELGVSPSAETEGLLEGSRPSPKTLLPDRPAPQAFTSHLIARDQAWAQMEAAWKSGQPIFMTGDPGMGKTRLVMEFAASKGAFILHHGRPGDQTVPFASITRGLRYALQTHPHLELPPWINRELSRLIPELSSEPLPPLSSQEDRLRLFEAVNRVYEGLERLGLYLLGDDLQFFDDSSLELLAYRLAGVGGNSLWAFRPEEVSGKFKEMVQRVVEAGQAALVELGPFAPPEVAQVLAQLISDNPNLDQLAPTLHRFTGGNPMFILETVRSLAQRGSLDTLTAERFEARRRVAGLPRSPKVTAVIGRRLGRLSGSAKDLARLAAILGEQFTLERAARVLDTSALALAPTCEELEQTQVWRGLKFSHDLLYQTTLEGIPQSLAPTLHGRVLEVLEGSGVPAAVLVRHAIAAGREEAIVRYSFQAGVETFALRALPQAVEHLERIRTMANQSPALSSLLTEHQRYSLYDTLLQCFHDFGLHQPQRKIPIEAEMLALGRTTADADLRQKIEVRAAYEHLYRTWDSQPLEHALQAGLEQARHTSNELREYQTLCELGWVNFLLDNFSESLGFYSGALELARKRGDQSQIGETLVRVGTQLALLGQWSEAEAAWAESATYLSAKDRLVMTEMLGHQAMVWGYCGRSEEALPQVGACLEVWREFHDHNQMIIARSRMVVASLEVGQYGEAYSTLLENQRHRQSRPPTIADVFIPIKGLTLFKLGQLEAARETLGEKLKNTGLAATHQMRSRPSLIAGTYALEGNWPKACEYALQAFEARAAMKTERFNLSPFLPRWLETEAILRGGQEDIAREGLHRLDEASQPYKRLRIMYLRSLAVLEAWEGKTGQAIITLEEARAMAQGFRLPAELWEIEARLAELLEIQGETARAHQARASALEGIQKLANTIDDIEIKRRFIEFAHQQVIQAAEPDFRGS